MVKAGVGLMVSLLLLFQTSHEVGCGEEEVLCMVKAGVGLMVSFRGRGVIRIYHQETFNHLQDVNVASAVTQILEGNVTVNWKNLVKYFYFFYKYFYFISSDFSDLPDMTDDYIDLSVNMISTLLTTKRSVQTYVSYRSEQELYKGYVVRG